MSVCSFFLKIFVSNYSEVLNKIAVPHRWPESLKNICKRVQFLSKLLGEGNCNCNVIVFGNKISNIFNFLEIDDDKKEDIEYEDETEEEEKEEDA